MSGNVSTSLLKRILYRSNSPRATKRKPSSRQRSRTLEPLEARYVLDSTVVFNEVMYNPTGADESLEFIELHNQQGVDMDISGWSFDRGVTYTFPTGTIIRRGGYLVIAADPVALSGAGYSGALGPYLGSLSNSGETLTLVNNSDRVMDEFDYTDDQPWPIAADGSGASLSKRNANAASAPSENWTISTEIGGTPGAANFPVVDLSPQSETLVPTNAAWTYDDSGTDRGSAWKESNYNDTAWQTGDAPLVAGNVTTPPTTAPASLVGYWTFDDTVEDRSASGINDGTIVGAAYDTSVPAAIGSGKSMSFSGLGSRVAIAPHVSLNSSAFTLSYWLKDPGQTNGTGTSGSGIGHNRITSRGSDSFDTAVNNTPATGGNSTIKFTVAAAWTETSFSTTPNQWIHMAYVSTGTTLTIYANGEQVYSAARTVNPTGLLNLGSRHTNNNTEGFVGNMDDVALWNVALSASSVQALASGAATPISVQVPLAIGSNVADWRVSTVSVDGGPTGTWNPSGNPPPAASTYTIVPTPTGPSLLPFINSAGSIMGVQGLLAGNNVRFYRTTFDLPVFGAISASIRMAVDAGAQMYLNGQLLATETTFSGETYFSPYPSITIAESGAVSVTKFDTSVATFTNWNVGTNEIVVAVRNLNTEGANAGGLAFRMDVQIATITGNTVVDLGPTTHYFRHEFDLDAAPSQVSLLELTPTVDDGAVYYLNGVEVFRRNMPAGAVSYGTLASTEIGPPVAGTPVTIPAASLRSGRNVLAVEVHQASLDSDDMAMAASLRAVIVPIDPRQPSSLKFDEAVSAELPFWVELVNTHSQSIDIGGYEIRSSNEFATPYVFASQNVAPGERLVVHEATLGMPIADNDKLFLYRPGGEAVADAVLLRNRSQARHADYGDRWLTPTTLTPGAANDFDLRDEIVINEILYNPRGFQGTPSVPATYQTTSLIGYDATGWKYNRSGTDLGANWYQTNHPVGGNWASGQTLIGVESSALPEPLRTVLPSYVQATITYYFQKEFTFNGSAAGAELVMEHIIDDGAVFYLNGVELTDKSGGSTRFNMPAGAINYLTRTTGAPDNATRSGTIVLDVADLNIGTNILSVEVHQTHDTSSDIVFGMRMDLREQLTPFIPGQPYRDNEQQWVELYNRSTETVDLTEWEINGVDYEFPPGTMIAPGEYLVVARDPATLRAQYPGRRILGPFAGEIQRGGEKLELRDEIDNPADVVEFFDSGKWHEFADGGGSSLELRDPDADNAQAQAWAASDETGQTAWQTVTYRGTAQPSSVGNDGLWEEFLLQMLDAGEVLLDDIRVTQNPASATPIQLIQNGTFDSDAIGAKPAKWRVNGTHGSHGRTVVVADPTNPTNKVLQLVATSAGEHMFNQIETTLKNGAAFVDILNNTEYEISYRVKHVTGDRQVNTRLYFNRLPRTTIIDAPQLAGTPGAQNSRYQANIGPTHHALSHSPAVPDVGQAATITVDAADPDGVASAVVWYSVNSGAWAFANMQVANGRLTGQIPGQNSGAVVQFYVESTDALGAKATFPALGRDSRALYQVEDNRAQLTGPAAIHNFRIIMTPADQDLFHLATNALSNDRIGATIIYDESEVFYDAGVRQKGSERGRRIDLRTSFNVEFQPDQLFRGVHDNVAVDRSGSGDQYSQKEILVEHIVTHSGDIPHEYSDLIRAITPRNTHTGTAMLMMARYGDVYLDSQYDNGGDGTLFEYELIYYPATMSVAGDPESPKLGWPQTDGVVGVNIRDLGDDKERYRWPFLIKNNRSEDDYSRIIDLAKTFSLTGTAYRDRIDEVIDVDQWLRAFAVGILTGIGDSYFSGSQHNLELYVRPEDNRVLLFPHDMDFSFTGDALASIAPGVADLQNLLAIPGNGHHYYGHVHDIVSTTFNSTYMTPWINHYDSLLPAESFGGFITYIANRSTSALTQINSAIPQVPFAITTNGGANMQVTTPTVTLQGTGWVNVRDIRVAGQQVDLPLTWVNNNTWQLAVPLGVGANALTLEAIDFQGNTIGTDTITVTTTSSSRPLQDFLRVSELMYHPADETAEELAAGVSDADEFEYIELENISDSVTLNLSGVKFIEGVQFDFANADITSLAPGERLLLVKNELAFELRNGPGLNIAGQYSGQLDNAGETLTIVDENNAVIQSFTYDDNGTLWHPTTDGPGYSLVIVDVHAATSQWSVGAGWRPSSQIGGSPGTVDGVLGDLDGNSRVDLADLAILQRSIGTTSGATAAMGDLNGDGAVNRIDAAILARNFGKGTAAPSPPAAPAAIRAVAARRDDLPPTQTSASESTRASTRRLSVTNRVSLDSHHVDRAVSDVSDGLSITGLRAQRRPRR
jgi:hypothetical protein